MSLKVSYCQSHLILNCFSLLAEKSIAWFVKKLCHHSLEEYVLTFRFIANKVDLGKSNMVCLDFMLGLTWKILLPLNHEFFKLRGHLYSICGSLRFG